MDDQDLCLFRAFYVFYGCRIIDRDRGVAHPVYRLADIVLEVKI